MTGKDAIVDAAFMAACTDYASRRARSRSGAIRSAVARATRSAQAIADRTVRALGTRSASGSTADS